ncbi:hypothetical protein GCM10023147_02660 [Tsukamurella soli]|uniref:DUF3558 domain-containing protein n=1 Tax=Tsukamurella soli TaxID=644556 RepID=A0ABP8J1Q3_9ACTN
MSGLAMASAAPPLPFAPTIAERWNRRNDGTSFEPCIAYSANEALALGMDPRTLEDAAISDSPNYRGCHWELTRRDGDSRGRWWNWVSQIVGNQPPLTSYKASHHEYAWVSDRFVDGRTFALGNRRTTQSVECYVVFTSGTALVGTAVNFETASRRTQAEECDRAFRIAALAASKAPR